MKQLAILVIAFAALSYGSQRVVVAEQFTATWCTYCPGMARGLFENYNRDYDTVTVIAYHSSSSGDPFYKAEALSRENYYNISGYPTCYFDGITSIVGGMHYGTVYPDIRARITARTAISSPLEITLTCDYDSTANTGTVYATIENTSASSITGTLHFVIVENDITYSWQGMTKLEFVMRDMLPTASGESVTIAAGDTINRSRDFTISGWVESKCKIVVFVQASNKEIYQGAEIGITNTIGMDYFGLTFTETSGEVNRYAQPGDAIRAYIMGKNNRDGTYAGGAVVTTSDPYVTITSSTPQSVAVGPGDVDTVSVLDFNIDPSCPSPHTVQFNIDFGTPGDTSTFNFIVTHQPGFSDDIESGQGGWMHSGMRDYWHITEHKSHSATHSWYSGVEGSWTYIVQMDASLVTPYFVASPDSSLRFWQQYFTSAGDYNYIDIDNGSGFWKTSATFTGTQSNWIEATYPLANYAGQTIRVRFRFISDETGVAEGWYIDDILVPILGVEENSSNVPAERLSVRSMPNLFSGNTVISFQVSAPGRTVRLCIYDGNGRLVRHWDHQASATDNRVIWTGTDDSGRQVNSGIYFVRLTDGANEAMTKVIRIK